MNFATYKATLSADLFRLHGDHSKKTLVMGILFGRGLQFIFWFRTSTWSASSKPLRFTVYPVARVMLRRASSRHGIDIPHGTRIGPGLYIGHAGGIVVNRDTVIGKNCNMSHGVTLGQGNRGPNKGAATVGDNVYFGPGAKVIGAVTIGSDVAVGANCVVTRDAPDYSVVAGVPGEVISTSGSEGYVTNRS